jgi:hypothetical protein
MQLNKIHFILTPKEKDQFRLKLLKNNNLKNPVFEEISVGYLGVLFQKVFTYIKNIKSVKITITYK